MTPYETMALIIAQQKTEIDRLLRYIQEDIELKKVRLEVRHLRVLKRGDHGDFTRGYRAALRDIEDVIEVLLAR
jgi:hypothetical protein